MKTAGFDIVLLLNEDFLNQISGAMFYNNFLTFNGNKNFKDSLAPQKLNQIPASLRDFLEIRYRCKLLHEPYLNFEAGNKIGITAHLRLYLWILQGVEVKFDADLTLETPLKIDNATKELIIVLKDAEVKQFEVNYDYSTTESIALQLHNIFEDALKAYFSTQEEGFAITLPSINAKLPYVPDIEANKVPIDIRALQTVGGNSLVVAANLFGYTGGNTSGLKEFVKNCNVGVGVSEMAMNKVYNFFWERTTWDKRFYKTGSFHVDMVVKVLDFLTELVDFIMSTSVKIVSLGFVETDLDFISSEFLYSLDIDFRTKPTFDILNGNKVRIYNLGVDLFVRLKMYTTFEHTVEIDTSGPVPDKCTPWDDDVVVSKKRKKILVFDIGVPIRNLKIKSCTGKLAINVEKKHLECIVEELDVNIFDYVEDTCDFLGLPAFIKDKIVDGMKKKVVDSIPPIVLTPTIFDLKIGFIDWPLNIEARKLHITNGEVVVGAYLSFKELQRQITPVPKYVVNINNGEIHRIGCDALNDTYETHQIGYYLLHNALKDKYDGCKKCLPAFHKR